MNKNYLGLIITAMMLLSIGSAYAALGVGSWVENNNTSLTITNGQTAEFRYGITAVTIYSGKYSIMLYREGDTNPLVKYAENLATVGNGALGRFNVTPSNYGYHASKYYILISSFDNYGSHVYRLNLNVENVIPPALSVTCDVNPSTGYTPVTSQFSSTVTGGTGPYTYTWSFGDGTTSNNNVAASHVYTTGTYQTSLSVKDSNGNTATANCGQVVVNAIIPPNTLKTSCVASPTSGTAPMNISIVSQTTGGTTPYRYEWTYGDGSVTTNNYKTILAYTYIKQGVYPVSLRVFDANNNVAEATCGIINVAAAQVPLSAKCSITPNSGTLPLSVNMSSQTSGGTGSYKYTWFFGDGHSTTIPLSTNDRSTQSYIYSVSGTYSVKLGIVDSQNNYLFVDCGQVVVNNVPPVVPINGTCTVAPTSGRAPLYVQIYTQITGGSGTYNYTLDMGDSQTRYSQYSTNSKNVMFAHNYTAANTYSPTLNIVDSANQKVTIPCGQVVVNTPVTPLTVTCNANPTSGTKPLNVTFTSSVTGGTGQYTYVWTFGDGSLGNVPSSVYHVYNTAGTYNPTLQVTDGSNNVITANCGQITVNTVPIPTNITATCNANPTSGTTPLTVTFTSTATGGSGRYDYFWVFGDGAATNGSSTASHVYSAAGSYNTQLVVSDDAYGSTIVNCGKIKVNESIPIKPLNVSCKANPTSGISPLDVQFTSSVTGGTGPYTYGWLFGDGSTSQSSSAISHTYTGCGTFAPTLIVTDAASTTVAASCGQITVSNNVTPPVKNMTVSCFAMPDNGTAPMTVLLNTVVSNGAAPYTFQYDYGNGTTSKNGNNIRLITYENSGTYNPTVNVIDNEGNTAFASCGLVVVSGKNGTNILDANPGGPYFGYVNEPVTFDASLSTGNIILYRWDFGDGTTSESNNSIVQHTYDRIDRYTATLTVYGPFGNSDSQSTTVTIVERTAPTQEDKDESRDLPDRGIIIKSIILSGNKGEILSSNDDMMARITIKNEWGSKLKNVRITLSIPELGIETRSSVFDFGRGSEHTEAMLLPLYDIDPGAYLVKIEVHNDQGGDEVRRIKYREIIVK